MVARKKRKKKMKKRCLKWYGSPVVFVQGSLKVTFMCFFNFRSPSVCALFYASLFHVNTVYERSLQQL